MRSRSWPNIGGTYGMYIFSFLFLKQSIHILENNGKSRWKIPEKITKTWTVGFHIPRFWILVLKYSSYNAVFLQHGFFQTQTTKTYNRKVIVDSFRWVRPSFPWIQFVLHHSTCLNLWLLYRDNPLKVICWTSTLQSRRRNKATPLPTTDLWTTLLSLALHHFALLYEIEWWTWNFGIEC